MQSANLIPSDAAAERLGLPEPEDPPQAASASAQPAASRAGALRVKVAFGIGRFVRAVA
jgi:hypothetical protein